MSLKDHGTLRSVRANWLVLALILVAGSALADAEHHPHWSYGGSTGPASWGTLENDYESCALGKTQSPINIREDAVHQADLPAIEFSYRPSVLRIIDNGHTIQVNYAPGSFITVAGHRYDLVQLHFHKPSEEQINDRTYDMVAHLVHRDSEGKWGVVAVLLVKGSRSPLIDMLWSHLPAQKEKENVVESASINVATLLPSDRAYYTFTGSLTTPPCTEGVTWFVLRNPSSISAAEIARFAAIYPMNARPVQALNGRAIEVSR
ncbi:MAG TPA: carbonic anhydrase family protein [Steroidobacteraceae bacterium]|jgi:carbonic anhydrase